MTKCSVSQIMNFEIKKLATVLEERHFFVVVEGGYYLATGKKSL